MQLVEKVKVLNLDQKQMEDLRRSGKEIAGWKLLKEGASFKIIQEKPNKIVLNYDSAAYKVIMEKLLDKYPEVPLIVVFDPDLRRPHFEGYEWEPVPGKGRWVNCWKLKKKVEEKDPLGDWTLPYYRKEGDWYMKTWIKMRDIQRLPHHLLKRLYVTSGPFLQYEPLAMDEEGKFYSAIRATQEVTGLSVEKCGAQIFNEIPDLSKYLLSVCPLNESWMVNVNGWPLKYVPRPYLRWLAYDRVFRREEKRKVWGYELVEEKLEVRPDDVLIKTIRQYLEREEWIQRKEDGEIVSLPSYVVHDKWDECETREFYGSGYWTGKNVYDPEKGEWVEQFLSTGTHRPRRDRNGGMKAAPEDLDPTPEGWQLGLDASWRILDQWTDHRQIEWQDGRPPMRVSDPLTMWKRLLRHLDWIEQTEVKWQARHDKGKEEPEFDQDRRQDLDHLLFVQKNDLEVCYEDLISDLPDVVVEVEDQKLEEILGPDWWQLCLASEQRTLSGTWILEWILKRLEEVRKLVQEPIQVRSQMEDDRPADEPPGALEAMPVDEEEERRKERRQIVRRNRERRVLFSKEEWKERYPPVWWSIMQK